jgi:hypothetical protein
VDRISCDGDVDQGNNTVNRTAVGKSSFTARPGISTNGAILCQSAIDQRQPPIAINCSPLSASANGNLEIPTISRSTRPPCFIADQRAVSNLQETIAGSRLIDGSSTGPPIENTETASPSPASANCQIPGEECSVNRHRPTVVEHCTSECTVCIAARSTHGLIRIENTIRKDRLSRDDPKGPANAKAFSSYSITAQIPGTPFDIVFGKQCAAQSQRGISAIESAAKGSASGGRVSSCAPAALSAPTAVVIPAINGKDNSFAHSVFAQDAADLRDSGLLSEQVSRSAAWQEVSLAALGHFSSSFRAVRNRGLLQNPRLA